MIETPEPTSSPRCCFELTALCTLASVFHLMGGQRFLLSHTLKIQAFEIFFRVKLAMEYWIAWFIFKKPFIKMLSLVNLHKIFPLQFTLYYC